MVNENDYLNYFEVNVVPSSFSRLEYISIQELKSIMTCNIPTKKEKYLYKEFLKAILEQISYFDINRDLIESSNSSGYTLGSFSEGSSNSKENSFKSITRISPIAHDILLNCGLLYNGLEEV